MRLRTLVISAAICGASVTAHADSITNFNLSAILQTGISQGIVTVDTANGRVMGGDFTVNIPASSAFPTRTTRFTNLQNAGSNGTNQIADFVSGTDMFALSLPVTSLVGYTGSYVCSTTQRAGCTIANSPGYYPTIYRYFGGELAAAAVTGSLTATQTPEPSTFMLLGAGLIGMIIATRQRWS